MLVQGDSPVFPIQNKLYWNKNTSIAGVSPGVWTDEGREVKTFVLITTQMNSLSSPFDGQFFVVVFSGSRALVRAVAFIISFVG